MSGERLGAWVERQDGAWGRYMETGGLGVFADADGWTLWGARGVLLKASGDSDCTGIAECKRDADAAARAHGYVLDDDPGDVKPADATPPVNLKAASRRVESAMDRAMVATAGLKDRTAADVVAVAALILAESRR